VLTSFSVQRYPGQQLPTGSQLLQYWLVTDDVKEVTFIVSDINGKACTGNKLIELSDLRGRNFQKLPVLLQPKCQFLGIQSILPVITGVIGVHPVLSAALM
jgi:hypothetical protein